MLSHLNNGEERSCVRPMFTRPAAAAKRIADVFDRFAMYQVRYQRLEAASSVNSNLNN